MCEAAPGIIYLLDRMGVPFNRTPEGLLDFRRFGGTLLPPHRLRRRHHRASSCSTRSTSRCAATRPKARSRKYECWEFLSAVLDDERRLPRHRRHGPAHDGDSHLPGRRGGPRDRRQRRDLRQDRPTRSSTPAPRSGASISRARIYANGEFIQVHPTAIPGEDKLRLMSESARGEGGRVWVPRKAGDKRDPQADPRAERCYFLEEKYPKYGNLVPRDIATREISQGRLRARPRHRRPADGLPRPHPHRSRDARIASSKASSRSTRSSSATIRAKCR